VGEEAGKRTIDISNQGRSIGIFSTKKRNQPAPAAKRIRPLRRLAHEKGGANVAQGTTRIIYWSLQGPGNVKL